MSNNGDCGKPKFNSKQKKSLFLLLFYILFCQRVVALDDANRNVGIEKVVGDADCEVFVALAGDKLPLSLVRLMIDHTNIASSGIVLPDETNIQVGTALFNDTHFAVKTLCDGQRSVHPIFPVTSEPVKFKVNLCPWTGLSEGACRSQQNDNEYGKHPLHAAKI